MAGLLAHQPAIFSNPVANFREVRPPGGEPAQTGQRQRRHCGQRRGFPRKARENTGWHRPTLSSCLWRCRTHKLRPRRVVHHPPTFSETKARAFWAGLGVLLLLVALYTAGASGSWAGTSIGLRPQGEPAAWLAGADALFQGTAPREPFFRAPAYLALLALLREIGVPASGLANAARVLNGLAHGLTTALLVGMSLRLWRWKGALLAGALWGFYPPAVFMAAQPGPASVALLVWLAGVAAALDTVWQSPHWSGGRVTARHAWAGPAIAGVAFVLAAALSATYWLTAIAWPLLAIFLGRDVRGVRMLAAALGVGVLGTGLVMMQYIWGGSRQPLAGADLYLLARAQETAQPWAAPLPVAEFDAGDHGADLLESEASLAYQVQTGRAPVSRAVLDGFWWRAALDAAAVSPPLTALRLARKLYQFFGAANFSAGPDFARARDDVGWLKFNPLGWTILMVMGLAGLALGWRMPGAGLTMLLMVAAGAGALLWFPTMEARAPVALILALFAGALPAQFWPQRRGRMAGLVLLMSAAAVLCLLPRPHDLAGRLAARDGHERAMASAALGDFAGAIQELSQGDVVAGFTDFDRELAAGWRFAELLKNLPALPLRSTLEEQMLDNADLAAQSRAAQFRCGACLWLLGRGDGALFYWENLADGADTWGAAARTAMGDAGRESPAQRQRRTAWEIGGGPQPKAELAPFFARLRADRAAAFAGSP